MHSITESVQDCIKCEKQGTLQKLLSNIFFKKSNISIPKKVGQVTEEFIDSAKEELQKHKEETITIKPK